ncbi:putative 26S proteasome regulatory subunit [Knufia fluminis]|nr:putative 26S proteasome regulatory subunit [Knufia fluminis]
MDNFTDPNLSTIHVPSGPTTYTHTTPDYSTLTLPQLITRKDNLEAELKALGSVLDSHGVTMNTTLTTFDGYPRADIDVAQIRVTRSRIIYLRNDWKGLMGRIERGLVEHHEGMKISGQDRDGKSEEEEGDVSTTSESGEVQTSSSPPSAPEAPFAKVNTVEPGSPAHEAGLKVGDLIRRFGSAIWSNHERLRRVGEVVQQNQGRPILVRVQRKTTDGVGVQELEVRVTPRGGWGGRGSLGCHVVPI